MAMLGSREDATHQLALIAMEDKYRRWSFVFAMLRRGCYDFSLL